MTQNTMFMINSIKKYRDRAGYSGNLQVALIDMDGVLYDSMKHHTLAWREMMLAQGIDLPQDEFYRFEGMTGVETIRLLFKRHLGKDITYDFARELYAVKSARFRQMGEPAIIPGIRDVLTTLKTAGIERVLVTGSGQQSILEKIDRDFPGLFSDKRITAADVVHGKPPPEPYMRGMEKAGAQANRCIVIENAPLGVMAGHASGCFTVGVTTGPIPRQEMTAAGADLVFDTMENFAQQLPQLIELMK